MKKIKFFFYNFFLTSIVSADDNIKFEEWKKNFRNIAIANNISEKTFDLVMSNTKFLPKCN